MAACSGLLAKESIVSTLGVLCPGDWPGCPSRCLRPCRFCCSISSAPPAWRPWPPCARRWPPRHFWFAVAYQTALAWLTAFGVYQVGTLLLRL
ncbi:MAG: hypothetical protein ACLR1T_12520 [Evtepia gabavorous]